MSRHPRFHPRDSATSALTGRAEAGAGKTRLLEEVRSRLDPEVVWLEGRAYRYQHPVLAHDRPAQWRGGHRRGRPRRAGEVEGRSHGGADPARRRDVHGRSRLCVRADTNRVERRSGRPPRRDRGPRGAVTGRVPTVVRPALAWLLRGADRERSSSRAIELWPRADPAPAPRFHRSASHARQGPRRSRRLLGLPRRPSHRREQAKEMLGIG